MAEEIKDWNKDTIYLIGEKVKWEGEVRILRVGSSIGVPPSWMRLIWR